MLNHYTAQRKPQIMYSLFNFLFWNIKYLFVIGCKCLYKIYCQLNRLSIPCRRPFEGSETEIMPLVCFQFLPSLIGWLWFTDPTLDSDWSGQFLWRSIILGIYLNIWLRPPPLSLPPCLMFCLFPSMCCCGSICRKYSVRQHGRVNTELTDTRDRTSAQHTSLVGLRDIK